MCFRTCGAVPLLPVRWGRSVPIPTPYHVPGIGRELSSGRSCDPGWKRHGFLRLTSNAAIWEPNWALSATNYLRLEWWVPQSWMGIWMVPKAPTHYTLFASCSHAVLALPHLSTHCWREWQDSAPWALWYKHMQPGRERCFWWEMSVVFRGCRGDGIRWQVNTAKAFSQTTKYTYFPKLPFSLTSFLSPSNKLFPFQRARICT